MKIKKEIVPQPEESPIQTFYGHFSGETWIGFQSFLTIDQAREQGIAYAREHNLKGFSLMTVREHISLEDEAPVETQYVGMHAIEVCVRHDVQLNDKHECVLCVAEDERI